MAAVAKPASFDQFYKTEYLPEHSSRANRALHVAGTTAGLLALAAFVATGRTSALIAAPVANYAFAWIGHGACENKKKKSWVYPMYSLMGGLRLWWETVTLQRVL